MYRKRDKYQLTIYDFILPFGGHLNKENRWVRLREAIDWDSIEEEYIQQFENIESGQEAFSSDLAFGSLYIQRKLGLTDRELVDQIAENPYMQYFIGFREFQNEKPFDPSLLVYFRKRFPEEAMNRIIEKMFIKKAEDKDPPGGSNASDNAPAMDPSNRTWKIQSADRVWSKDIHKCSKWIYLCRPPEF